MHYLKTRSIGVSPLCCGSIQKTNPSVTNMSSKFVPFPAMTATSPGHPAATAFAPVVANTAQKNEVVQASPDSVPILNPTQACAPIVDVERDGARITQIRIKCSCGEVIELDC